MKYLFRPEPNGKQLRSADNVRGTLIEIQDTAKVYGPLPVLETRDGIVDYVTTPTPPPRPEPVRTVSKLAIRRQLREWGMEAAFESVLDAVPHARADWNDCQDIRTNDPLFAANKEAFKAALGLSDNQFFELLRL